MTERATQIRSARTGRFCRREAIPASPPPRVLDAIGAASDVYDELEATGRHVHFDVDAETGAVTIQVLDTEGDLVGTVAPAHLLDIAAGAPLD